MHTWRVKGHNKDETIEAITGLTAINRVFKQRFKPYLVAASHTSVKHKGEFIVANRVKDNKETA